MIYIVATFMYIACYLVMLAVLEEKNKKRAAIECVSGILLFISAIGLGLLSYFDLLLY